jgi:hypothetical protein
MRVLLDTHVLLWALAEPRRLDTETRATIESGDRDAVQRCQYLGDRHKRQAWSR